MFPSFDLRCCQFVHLFGLVIGYLSAVSSVDLTSPVSDLIAYLVPAVCVGTVVVGLAVGYNAVSPGRLNMALAMLLTFVGSIAVAYLFKPDQMMIQLYEVPISFVVGFLDGANLNRGDMLVLIVLEVAAAVCCFAIFGTYDIAAAILLAEAIGSISGLVFRQNLKLNLLVVNG